MTYKTKIERIQKYWEREKHLIIKLVGKNKNYDATNKKY